MNIPLRRYWELLRTYLRPQRARFIFLALVLLGSIGLQLYGPQILRYFIDLAMSGGSQNALVAAALFFIGVALVQQLASVLATYLSESVGWTATNTLRVDLAAHCLRLDLSFHKAHTPGELIERIDGDVTALASFFSQFVIGVLGNILLLLGILLLLLREEWRVGLAISAFALIALYSMFRLRSINIPRWTAMREMSGRFFGFLGEHLEATEDIRANGSAAYVMRRLYGFFRQWLPVYRRAYMGGVALDASNRMIFGTGIAVAFALGAYLWDAKLLSLGSVFLIFSYTSLLQHPLIELRTRMQDLQTASASIVRIEELLSTTAKIIDGSGEAIPVGALTVSFDHVSFGYDTENVLRDLTFTIPPGQVLGLLGRTGSGKTTLARLLFRLYDPTQGEICLSHIPLRAAGLSQARRRVGMVTQDIQLFHATVRDNLTLFDRSTSDAEILRVLQELELSAWYQSLANGLDSELEGSSGLSVGEAQLLAFARAFLKAPGLVILDEASAHLDPNTEQRLERAIGRLLSDRTGIIIAHRLATVQRTDAIMILEDGRIAEYGARIELMRNPNSRFSQLLHAGMDEVLA